MLRRVLGVDPGLGGGFALAEEVEGAPLRISLYNMPDTPGDILTFVRELPSIDMAFMERVGGHRPGNSAIATATFNRHIGQLEMALLATGIPVTLVAPQTWMKTMGSLDKEKGERKRQIKNLMQQRYPAVSSQITLKTADALGILTYGLNTLISTE